MEDGGVVVRDGIIIDIGRSFDLKKIYPEAIQRDLEDVILMPGLINAHIHLDYTMMRHQLEPRSTFASWIESLNKIKFSLQEEEIISAIMEGAKELRQWGCTTAANIISFPNLLQKLPEFPLRLLHLIEVMDIRGAQQGKEGLKRAESFFEKNHQNDIGKKIKFGISPHSPQTASPDLYRTAGQLVEQYRIPFCTHLAESKEEFEMFVQGNGSLFDFLKKFGRDMSDCGFQTPLQALLTNNLLPHSAMLVHMNCLTKEDHELLAKHENNFFVVHCPKTHQFFDRATFDWKFFYDCGYRLSLGTDSLASNDELNLFSEMQLFVKTAPDLVLEEVLKMVTLHPAEALGMKGRLGELSVGAFADMIAIPFSGKKREVIEAVVQNKIFPLICNL